MENKTPKFKRPYSPSPQGARSKSKIKRAHGKLVRVVATIQDSGPEDVARIVYTNGKIFTCAISDLQHARPGDEANFNAQYQRHLRKVDADKIKHPRK